MLAGSLSIITVGFGLGLMHALDADHVMAVSSLSNNKPGFLRTLKFCLNWAVGHAGILLLSGALLFGLGFQLPGVLIYAAEVSVGVLLVVLGLVCFWQIRRQRLSLVEHSHGALVHRHWRIVGDDGHQVLNDADTGGARSKTGAGNHAPVMVGVLHGLAGSAPALALVPVMAQGQFFAALCYLLVFSLGVGVSMLFFGFGFAAVQRKFQARYVRLFQWQRHFIASCSIVAGGFWIAQTL